MKIPPWDAMFIDNYCDTQPVKWATLHCSAYIESAVHALWDNKKNLDVDMHVDGSSQQADS